jgi:hypothetical protein
VGGVTLVTALVDLGRESLSGGFERSYQDYLDRFVSVLAIDRPMVIYADAAAEGVVWRFRQRRHTVVHRLLVEDLKRMAGWSAVQRIRVDPAWRRQADWLAASPQATLAAYNPLVMSKLPWLAQVAEQNPFGTPHVAWVDAALGRTVAAGWLRDALGSGAILGRLRRFLFLCFPYESGHDIHGFPRAELTRLAGTSSVRWVARGGFFGGRVDYVRQARHMYDALLSDTLARGLMGTEESIFTIMAHLHPALFERYSIGDDGLVWPFFHEVACESTDAADQLR